jgi:hypothetical protein
LLLTVGEYRKLAGSSLEDPALQLLLDAAEQAIERELGGPVGEVTEVVDGGLTYITLRRRASEIVSVTETWDATDTILGADDYRLRYDARSLFRLANGTHPAGRWGQATVVYAAEDDADDRKRAQKALVELDHNYVPGATAEQIGAWMEQHQQSAQWNYQSERAAILATLWPAAELDFA